MESTGNGLSAGTAGSWSTPTQLFIPVGGNSTMSVATSYQVGQINAGIVVDRIYTENDNPLKSTSLKFAKEIVPY